MRGIAGIDKDTDPQQGDKSEICFLTSDNILPKSPDLV
jgi:hypothetical protein